VFLTGQGPVNPAVPTGAAAPLTTLSHATLPVAANLGGRSAGLSFLGLAPGFAGLAQANVQIPPEVAPGNEVVLFLTVGGQASNTVHIAVK
jgi:adhesin/invasin